MNHELKIRAKRLRLAISELLGLEIKMSQSLELVGDDREFGKNRTLSFASSCNQFIVFSMDERKWRKLFDKQIGIL